MDETDAGQRPDEPPDTSYVLANERTFLAWIRSSLALLAGGVALARFEPHTHNDRGLVLAVSSGCVALAVVFSIGGYLRWMRVRDAIEAGGELPTPHLVPVMAIGVFALAVLSLILVYR